MRIALVAPLYESVPPALYGGTERIVAYLADALVEAGHDVTLYATGDSATRARLVPVRERSLRLGGGRPSELAAHLAMLEQVRREAARYDVIHLHVDLLPAPFFRDVATPALLTLHGRLDLDDLPRFYALFPELPLVAISASQAAALPRANWLGTVHHGLPPDLLRPPARPAGDYLAFLGRLSPEKGPERAIAIARRCGVPLRIGAKVDAADATWFRNHVAPLLDDPLVEYVGEIGDADKAEFLGHARALLFPIQWPEPFGLVMIEAMACGTPVIAFPGGSVPEVIEDGVTGFIVGDEAAAVQAVDRLGALDRARIRRCFEARFTARRMAADYLALYRRLRPERAGDLASCPPPRPTRLARGMRAPRPRVPDDPEAMRRPVAGLH